MPCERRRERPRATPAAEQAARSCHLSQLATIVAAYDARRRDDAPSLVSLGGSVAAGKSTLAQALARELAKDGLRVEVVSTDGFLLSDEELTRRGQLEQKGLPHTHDQARLAQLFRDLRRRGELHVPRYCHCRRAVTHVDTVAAPDLLILEGVAALDAVSRHGVQTVCTLYIEATLAMLERWYIERYQRTRACEGQLGSEQRALSVWRAVNLPNLRDHIAPWRSRADVVVYKNCDHEIARMLIRTTSPCRVVQTR